MISQKLMETTAPMKADGTQEVGPIYAITEFCNAISQRSKGLNGETLDVGPSDAKAIIEVILLSMSDCAKERKSKENSIAIVIDSLKGAPILSLKVTHEEGTEDDPEGSWEPSYVFGKDDVEGCVLYNISDPTLHTNFINRAASYGFKFANPSFIYTAVLAFAEAIYAYLDAVAVEGEDVTLEHENFFSATVSVRDGIKVMTFAMNEEVSNIIKSKNNNITAAK